MLILFSNLQKLVNNNSTWLDIGSYYGGLQGLVKKYYPESKMIMVDFNHQLTRSYIYLKQLYPGANHVFPNEISSIKSLGFSIAAKCPPPLILVKC